jgi:hypothetical protein
MRGAWDWGYAASCMWTSENAVKRKSNFVERPFYPSHNTKPIKTTSCPHGG